MAELSMVDRKITQSEADRLMASMELDLVAYYKVLSEDIVKSVATFKGTSPEEYFDMIAGWLEQK